MKKLRIILDIYHIKNCLLDWPPLVCTIHTHFLFILFFTVQNNVSSAVLISLLLKSLTLFVLITYNYRRACNDNIISFLVLLVLPSSSCIRYINHFLVCFVYIYIYLSYILVSVIVH
ncbi:hypothetical protein V1514DRAFT_337530 [Lipomyces japonicus]|uniref:uncharacterized protein n=1 Tax=Lipomyces japonicus TaxID=56871 RepID=UPI0034CE0C11